MYPLEDIHILNAEQCQCVPEVRYTSCSKMVVHKKCTPAPLKPAYKAHWVK